MNKDKKILEILNSKPSQKIGLDDFYGRQTVINMLKEAINYSHCCTQLKSKKAPTFEHWLICNFEETSTGNYIDFNNGYTYRDKQVLKLKYNKIFKPSI